MFNQNLFHRTVQEYVGLKHVMIYEVEKNLCANLLFEFLHAYDMSASQALKVVACARTGHLCLTVYVINAPHKSPRHNV